MDNRRTCWYCNHTIWTEDFDYIENGHQENCPIEFFRYTPEKTLEQVDEEFQAIVQVWRERGYNDNLYWFMNNYGFPQIKVAL